MGLRRKLIRTVEIRDYYRRENVYSSLDRIECA